MTIARLMLISVFVSACVLVVVDPGQPVTFHTRLASNANSVQSDMLRNTNSWAWNAKMSRLIDKNKLRIICSISDLYGIKRNCSDEVLPTLANIRIDGLMMIFCSETETDTFR